MHGIYPGGAGQIMVSKDSNTQTKEKDNTGDDQIPEYPLVICLATGQGLTFMFVNKCSLHKG